MSRKSANSYENFDPFGEDFERDVTSATSIPVNDLYETCEDKNDDFDKKKKHKYDEMTINSGKPVFSDLNSVSFESPLKESAPIPAPRLSKQKPRRLSSQNDPENNEDIEEDNNNQVENVIYEELSHVRDHCSENVIPEPPPRNDDNSNLYSELEIPKQENYTNVMDFDIENQKEDIDNHENKKLEDLPTVQGASRLLKSKTIDIRKDVNKLWEDAVKELDRDESLVEFIEKHEEKNCNKQPLIRRTSSSRSESKNAYDSVAVPEQRFKIVNGVQVPIPVTLLKNFDPYFELQSASSSSNTSSKASSRSSSPMTTKESIPSTSSLDFSNPQKPKQRYENVWIPPEGGTPEIESNSNKSSLKSEENPKDEEVEEETQKDVQSTFEKSAYQFREQEQASALPAYKSPPLAKPTSSLNKKEKDFSPKNLSVIAKRLSFVKIGRKVIKSGSKEVPLAEEEDFSDNHEDLQKPPIRKMSSVSHSGPLLVLSKSRKAQMQEKWVVLANANLQYFNQKNSLADPKELVHLRDILSVSKRSVQEQGAENNTLFAFDVAFVAENKSKLSVRTFAAQSISVRDVWTEKIAANLNQKLSANLSHRGDSVVKFGWVYFKVRFFNIFFNNNFL